VTPLAELLADRIRRFGPLTFADYMRECPVPPGPRLLQQSGVQAFRRLLHERRRASHLCASPGAAVRGDVGKPRRSGGTYGCGGRGAGVGRFAAHVLDFCEAKLPAFLWCPAVRCRRAIRFETRTGKDRNEAPRDRRAISTASAEVPAHIAAGWLFFQ